ncbi:oligosaccharide repeat unit polymerase [Halolactibacillus miurensis]|uniref:Oligosaccharide repeat unit polymerase n=2 Tax=Halolactibacillus miurensis TaxID=306541 RepID=A0A1I6SPT3_9BACI|nr:oligosaccharide repeat unit polymerase [Halolactibacillus miurensis]SFS78964.1 hypothetical protein SAMN05421668_11011 [Halolactibacillus miurensis]
MKRFDTNKSSYIYIIIYRLMLDFIYKGSIVTSFGYYGFKNHNSPLHYFFSWILLLVFAPVITKIFRWKTSPSKIVILFLLLLSFVPFTTMLGFHSFTNTYYIANIIYWLSLLIFTKVFANVKFLEYKRFNKSLNNTVIWIMSAVFLSVVIFISWRFTGFRLNFNLFEVYEFREEAGNFNLPTIISYLYSASNAINPIILVYALIKRNHFLAMFIIFVQMLSFSINGSKSVFFITLLSIFVFMFFKSTFFKKIPQYFTLLGFAAILETGILKTSLITNFIIRRVNFVPNLLNYYYFDFFTKYQPDYFQQSFLRYFGFQSNYTRIPNLIGMEYFGRPGMAANSGLISDAITNLGLVGVIIAPMVLAIILKIFDDVTIGLDNRIFIIPSIYISYVLISSFLFTSLLTHGFFAMMFIFYFLPRKSKQAFKLRKKLLNNFKQSKV